MASERILVWNLWDISIPRRWACGNLDGDVCIAFLEVYVWGGLFSSKLPRGWDACSKGNSCDIQGKLEFMKIILGLCYESEEIYILSK